MRIVVDIGHPAHVHLFKNFVWEMQKRGHEILITASKKEVSLRLLDAYGFDYIPLGSYGSSNGLENV
jgi:predicted glycosyltransferase